jgi:hypothetical protein
MTQPNDKALDAAMESETAILADVADTRSINIDDIDSGDEYEAAGIYPQDDGTVKIVLDMPLKSGDKEIWVVTLLRAPSAGESDKAGGRAALLNMSDSAHMAVLPAITEPSISANIYRRMLLNSPMDTTNLMVGINSFFLTSRRGVKRTG